MKNLYKLRDSLLEELEKYGQKEMSAGSLDIVDKIAHAVKNIDKVIKCEEQEQYSGRSYRNSYDEHSYRDMAKPYVRPDGSYRHEEYSERGRDSMGRYSRHNSVVSELKMLMDDADDEMSKREIKKLIDRMEHM